MPREGDLPGVAYPPTAPTTGFTPDLAENAFQTMFSRDHEPKIAFADDYWWQSIVVDRRTGTLDFVHDDHEARKSFGQGLIDAAQAARPARFECGTEGLHTSDRDITER
jgi:hypothetical protein